MTNGESPSQKVSSALWSRIQDFFSSVWTGFFDLIVPSSRNIAKAMIDGLLEHADMLMTVMPTFPLTYPVKLAEQVTLTQEAMESFKDEPTPTNAFKAFFLQIVASMTLVTQEASVIGAKLQRELNKEYAPKPIELEQLINLWYKNPELQSFLSEAGKENGYSEEDLDKMFHGARSMLNTEEIKELYWRQELSDEERASLLYANGFKEDAIDQLLKLYEVIPAVPDLVRMAVREAFTPEIIADYDLHADFPADFSVWAETKGLTEYWAKAYWAAHWELPSLMMGYEMYHRGVISQNELLTLMRTQDIMPFWRERLIEISHNPFTRVDVRRMFQLGVLDVDEVFESYLDIGYNVDKAEKMTQFTIAYTTEKDRDLTKGEVLDGFKKGILEEGLAREQLTLLGYSEGEQDFYIYRALYDIEQKKKELSLSNVKRLYIKGLINLNETYDLVGKLNLPSKEMEYLINEWDIEKAAKDTVFPLDDLHDLFQQGYIKKDIYRSELDKLGFSEKYIDWFVTLKE